ncbi:MAG TPA: serine hydrolase [Albitalea sp.]|uniref:serine hydrolase domain-containing protein n=1 Tax=Piscinibacter sp. TaxID=1903157 RepID=UPI002ED1335C
MTYRYKLQVLVLLSILGTSGCAWLRPDLAARTATGTTAHDLCSETFVSGLDPNQAFAENIRPRPGFSLIASMVRYEVDREQGEVRASFAGGFASRAVYRGPEGCALVKQPGTRGRRPPERSAAPSGASTPAASPALQAAVDEAFAENVRGAQRATKAVLVLHRGRVVAERYAPGYGPATPVLGFSMSKSVTSALVGILVRDGRLRLDMPIQLEGDGHTGVTLENLLRMTSGLDLDETGSGFDPSNHVLYVHTDDMAAFAAKAKALAPAGQRFGYSTASTHLAARLVRDAAGGAEAVQRFAHERLFGPLGMQHVTMETDETGTPIGGHYILASAPDWARFGALYLNNGMTASGRRLLPEDWVRWSTTPTLSTNYGGGWWLNRRGPGPTVSGYNMPLMPDVPPDAFYALGNLGQYLVVIPSRELVVVRLGRAHTHDVDVDGMNRLLAATLAALPP